MCRNTAKWRLIKHGAVIAECYNMAFYAFSMTCGEKKARCNLFHFVAIWAARGEGIRLLLVLRLSTLLNSARHYLGNALSTSPLRQA